VLQCVAVRCSVLQCTAVYCSEVQCVAVCCSVLQCVAVYCNMLQCGAVCWWAAQFALYADKCVAVCCSVLQCVAACCSVLQCVAACCGVLQCVSGLHALPCMLTSQLATEFAMQKNNRSSFLRMVSQRVRYLMYSIFSTVSLLRNFFIIKECRAHF